MSSKPKVEDNILNAKQQKKFVESARFFDEKILAYGLLYTGMRVSEFLHLREKWIDWDKKNPPKYYGAIEIPKEMRCECYECKAKRNGYWRAKTKRATRVIPILEEPSGYLKSFFDHHSKIMDLIPHRQEAWRIIKRLGKRAGFKVFPHALRGTFATILAAKDFSADVIQDTLGWAQPSTANKYIRLSGEQVLSQFEEKW